MVLCRLFIKSPKTTKMDLHQTRDSMDATKDWTVPQYQWIGVPEIGNRNIHLKPITSLRCLQSNFNFLSSEPEMN